MSSLLLKTAIRGYHVYRAVWETRVGNPPNVDARSEQFPAAGEDCTIDTHPSMQSALLCRSADRLQVED